MTHAQGAVAGQSTSQARARLATNRRPALQSPGELESYLASGRIVRRKPLGDLDRIDRRRILATLEDGSTVLCKSGREEAESNNERAAWLICQLVGGSWLSLVPVTVLRQMPMDDDSSENVLASVQIYEPGTEGMALERFCEEDLLRAAVFDYAVRHADRMMSNWLGIATDSRPRLKLFDHEHAFNFTHPLPDGSRTPLGAFRSAFWQRSIGQPISPELHDELVRLNRGVRESEEIRELIDPHRLWPMFGRTHRLANASTVPED